MISITEFLKQDFWNKFSRTSFSKFEILFRINFSKQGFQNKLFKMYEMYFETSISENNF